VNGQVIKEAFALLGEWNPLAENTIPSISFLEETTPSLPIRIFLLKMV
jgi:hypothetical protein